jgi:inhibitor of cysteine peptidase
MDWGTIKSVRAWYLATVLALAATACTATAGGDVTVTAADSGTTVALQRGDTLVLELEANPTTGFQWEVASVDAAILEQQGDPEFESSEPGKVGSGGKLIFRFRAKESGTTTLEMVYHRAWDKETPPLQTFELSAVIT